ncbi:MAG TPA: FHA domain-containing protein [Verrucomicrobiae bacterium]|nr:FHA domain-containing protein [Verrucomicrobiae bacterium]
MPKIVLKKDSEIIQIFRLEAKNLRVGSDRLADVKIDDWTVGKEEAVIWPKGQQFFIKPVGAFPQLFVNGAEVSAEQVLKDGDEIKIGPYVLVFSRLPEEMEGLALEPPPVVSTPFVPPLPEAEPLVSPPVPPQREPEPPTPHPIPPVREPEREVPTSKIPQVKHPAPPPPLVTASHDTASEKTMIAAMPGRTKASDAFEMSGRVDEYYLLAVWGPLAGRRFQLKSGETKIGRDKEANEIVVREDEQGELDTSISRRHASFFWSNIFAPGGGGINFSIIDVGSKLGVMVNGKKIKPEKGFPLQVGDEIGILSEKAPTIFRLASGDRLDFAPPRMGKEPKNQFFEQKIIWIIGGIIILFLVLGWIVLK